MNRQDLRVLLDYHYWARDRMLAALEPLTPEQFTCDLGSSFRSIRDTVAHVYVAEWAWYMRWQRQSPTAPLAPETFPDLASVRKAWTDQEAKTRAFLETLDDEGIHRIIGYRTIAGQSGASSFAQMFQHLVNHGSYHRGQLTTMLRQIGAVPPKSTDLIAFYRISRV